jgi:hypothetical protein
MAKSNSEFEFDRQWNANNRQQHDQEELTPEEAQLLIDLEMMAIKARGNSIAKPLTLKDAAIPSPYGGLILEATPEELNTNATNKAKKYLMRVEKPVIENGWAYAVEGGRRIKKFVFLLEGRFEGTGEIERAITTTGFFIGKQTKHFKEVYAALQDIAQSWGIDLDKAIRLDGDRFSMTVVNNTRDTRHALSSPPVRTLITDPEYLDGYDFVMGSLVLEASFNAKGQLFFKPEGFIEHHSEG